MDPRESEVVETIAGRERELVDLLCALIGFDTTATVEGEAGEAAALQSLIAGRLEGAGFEVETWEPGPSALPADRMGFAPSYSFAGRPQLLAFRPGTGGGRSLLLNGHVDVVDPAPRDRWTSDPFCAEVRDRRVFGRGAADMKGGVAAMIVAAETLAALDPPLAGDLLVNTVTDEESTGAGSAACVARDIAADGGLIPEPTGLSTWLGARGSLRATITVEGRVGHAGLTQPHWRSGGAVNAVDKMTIVQGALERLAREWRDRHATTHAHLAPGGIAVTGISADAWMVSLPGRCTLDCHLQYLPAQADQSGWGAPVEREVEAAVLAAARTDSWLREHPPLVTWSDDVPASVVEPDSAIVQAALSAADAVGDLPRIARETTFFDGPTFTRAGTPTIALGPGHIVHAHAVDEHVAVDQLVAAAQRIAITAMRFCTSTGRSEHGAARPRGALA